MRRGIRNAAGPLGCWTHAELRTCPRFPHQDSFPTAKSLIDHFLRGALPYRDLRIALFWMGFGLLSEPTQEEPTLTLVPLCKDLDTYMEIAADLGYNPEASVHLRPVCSAARPGVGAGSSGSGHAGSSGSGSSGSGSTLGRAEAPNSSNPPATPNPAAGNDRGEPAITAEVAQPLSEDSGLDGSKKDSGMDGSSKAQKGLPPLSEVEIWPASSQEAPWKKGPPPLWLQVASSLQDEPEAHPEQRQKEQGGRASRASGSSSHDSGPPAPSTLAARSVEGTADSSQALGSRSGETGEAVGQLAYKLKLLHAGGWSSESDGSGSSSGDGTPPMPASSTSVSALGLDAHYLDQFTVSFVSAGVAGEADAGICEQIEESPGCLCAFCLDEMCFGETLCRLPCMHTFHRRCVHSWLERDRRCMLCRSDITRPRG